MQDVLPIFQSAAEGLAAQLKDLKEPAQQKEARSKAYQETVFAVLPRVDRNLKEDGELALAIGYMAELVFDGIQDPQEIGRSLWVQFEKPWKPVPPAPQAGAEEGSFGVVAVGGVIAAVPAWARGSTFGVTVGFAQTRVVVEMGTLPPDRLVAVAAGAEEAKAIEVLGVPAVQIVESKPVAVRLAQGILEVVGGFGQVRVLNADAARTLRELRLWFQGLPAAWQGSMSAGVEEQVLQLEDLSQVGV